MDAFSGSTKELKFHDFLEKMKSPSARDLVQSIRSFIVSFQDSPVDSERDSARVQQFMSETEASFRAHPLFAGANSEDLESAGEGLEKYLMTKVFARAFPSTIEDVERDRRLWEQMAALQQFIRPEHLDIPPNSRPEASWLLAQKALQQINAFKAPRDKVVCILNCCRVITNLLRDPSPTSEGQPPGADDFLPVLIYVVVKANPPQLHCNLAYIQQYRHHSRLVSEAAYFYTNLVSTVAFVENLKPDSLSIDPQEFEHRMQQALANVASAAPPHPVPTTPPTLARPSTAPELPPQNRSPASTQQRPLSPPKPSTADGTLPAATYHRRSSSDGAEPGVSSHGLVPPLSTAKPLEISPGIASQQGVAPATTTQRRPETKGVPTSAEPSLALPPSQISGLGSGAHTPEQTATLEAPAGGDQNAVSGAALRTVSELEASAVELVVEAARSGELGARHRFLYSTVGDLRLGDVEGLLGEYKELVLRYEGLVLAVGRGMARAIPIGNATGGDVQVRPGNEGPLVEAQVVSREEVGVPAAEERVAVDTLGADGGGPGAERVDNIVQLESDRGEETRAKGPSQRFVEQLGAETVQAEVGEEAGTSRIEDDGVEEEQGMDGGQARRQLLPELLVEAGEGQVGEANKATLKSDETAVETNNGQQGEGSDAFARSGMGQAQPEGVPDNEAGVTRGGGAGQCVPDLERPPLLRGSIAEEEGNVKEVAGKGMAWSRADSEAQDDVEAAGSSRKEAGGAGSAAQVSAMRERESLVVTLGKEEMLVHKAGRQRMGAADGPLPEPIVSGKLGHDQGALVEKEQGASALAEMQLSVPSHDNGGQEEGDAATLVTDGIDNSHE